MGRDELTAGWPHRPFQVEWDPGDELVLEIYDAKPGLFNQPQKFTLAHGRFRCTGVPAQERRLSARARPANRSDRSTRESITSCSQSERVGGPHPQDQRPTQVAERPIVIK